MESFRYRGDGQALSRSRIVASATTLLLQCGIVALTPAAISNASGISEHEVQQSFTDSDALVEAVVDAQLETVLQTQRPSLDAVHTLSDLHQWRTNLLDQTTSASVCPLGLLIYHLAGHHARGHRALTAAFSRWHNLLTGALTRIQEHGELAADADPATLATGIMAALQGGYLLAHTAQNTQHLHTALDLALNHLQMHMPPDQRE